MRVLLVALFMVLAIALPPDERGSGEHEQPQQGLSEPAPPQPPTVQETDEASQLNEPCSKGEENRSSDLCAQWKAADAAKESADWTRRTFYTAISGVVVGVLTLGAAVAAALFARQAAIHTETGAAAAIASANAATRANDWGEMRWVAENRPWLTITEQPTAMLYSNENGRINVVVKVKVKNVGKIPAFDVTAKAEVRAAKVFFETSATAEKFAAECTKPINWRWGNTIIFPDAGETVHGITEEFPDVGPEHRYAIILVCITYRAMGHSQSVFHTAMGLWAPAGDLDPKTEVNEPNAVIADSMTLTRIGGCNSLG